MENSGNFNRDFSNFFHFHSSHRHFLRELHASENSMFHPFMLSFCVSKQQQPGGIQKTFSDFFNFHHRQCSQFTFVRLSTKCEKRCIKKFEYINRKVAMGEKNQECKLFK